VEAILSREAAALQDALEIILNKHISYTRGYLRRSYRSLLCIKAACLAILGRHAGMEVRVADRFHKVRLLFNVISLEEWQGEAAYRQKFYTFADIFPVQLLE